MIGVNRERWWRRSVNVEFGPAAATFGGIAFGAAVGCVLAFQSFDRITLVISLTTILMGGAWGYTCWLISDRAREDRFFKVVWLIALVAIAALLLAFPDLWSLMHRANRRFVACLFFGGIVGTSMLVVGTGWGLVHLVRYLSSPLGPRSRLACLRRSKVSGTENWTGMSHDVSTTSQA